MKYHINPKQPLLFRHFEVIKPAGLDRYIRRTSTAVNEHKFGLDDGPDNEPLARKSWWEEEK